MNPLSPATTRPTGRGIGFYFWATILVLIAATLILVGLALLRPLPDAPPALAPPPATQLPSWGWQGMGVLIEPQEQAAPMSRPAAGDSLLEVRPIPLRAAPVEPAPAERSSIAPPTAEPSAVEPEPSATIDRPPTLELESQP